MWYCGLYKNDVGLPIEHKTLPYIFATKKTYLKVRIFSCEFLLIHNHIIPLSWIFISLIYSIFYFFTSLSVSKIGSDLLNLSFPILWQPCIWQEDSQFPLPQHVYRPCASHLVFVQFLNGTRTKSWHCKLTSLKLEDERLKSNLNKN